MKVVGVVQCTANDLYKSKNPDNYCITALKESKIFDKIVLCVPKIGNYEIFKSLSKKWGVDIYFGSNYNVAKRIFNAVKKIEPTIIVRVLLKSFFIDIEIVKKMITKLLEGYDNVNLSRNFNYAVAADVITFDALKKIVKILNELPNDHKTNLFKFSPWIFLESRRDFRTFTLNSKKKWDDARIKNVKKKIKTLLNNDENKHSVEINNPVNRYGFLLKFLKKNDIVLDIACGKGGGTYLISKKVNKVVGIDYNEDYIVNARKNYSRKNVKFSVGTDKNLKEYGQFFDKIVSSHTLEHVKDDKKFLKRLFNSLKNDGELILEVPRLFRYPLGEPLYPFHIREYERKQLESLLVNTGFKIIESFGGNRHSYVDIKNATNVLFFRCKK